MGKKSILFYREWAEILLRLPETLRHKVSDALLRYIDHGEEPDDPEVAYSPFMSIRTRIDKDKEQYDATCEKNRENVKKRWAKQAKDTTVFNRIQKIQPNTNYTDKEEDKEDGKDKDKGKDKVNELSDESSITTTTTTIPPLPPTEGDEAKEPPAAPPRKKFIPPTVDQVQELVTKRGYIFDPEEFVAYYESNGWMVGRHKMKKWEAAAVTWQRKELDKQRYINRNNTKFNGQSTNQHRPSDRDAEKQRRDAEFASHIVEKLRSAGSQGEVQDPDELPDIV